MVLSDLQTITGLSIIITIIVQLIKRWIPSDDDIRLAAIGIGIVLSIIATMILGPRDIVSIGNAVLTGFFGGSSSVGLYALQKPLRILSSNDRPTFTQPSLGL